MAFRISVTLLYCLAASPFVSTTGRGSMRAEAVHIDRSPNNSSRFATRHHAIKLLTKLEGRQSQPVEEKHDSWHRTMGKEFLLSLFGTLLIFSSMPVMWLNERHSAMHDALVSLGRSECTNVDPSVPSADLRGTLVRVQGGIARSSTPVHDNRFANVQFNENCLRLRTEVEVFQWIETSATVEKRNDVGGGTTKETSYEYHKEWTGVFVASEGFQDKSKVNHVSIAGLQLGTDVKSCARVEYGEAFLLPPDLVEQLVDFTNVGEYLGTSVTFDSWKLTRYGDYYYYPNYRVHCVGDIRVKFERIVGGPMTVIALQAKHPDASESRDTFLPYRVIYRRYCCPLAETELKERLLIEGRKSADELYERDACSCGLFWPILCCCIGVYNLVASCYSGLLPPQVFRIFVGEVSFDGCFEQLKYEAGLTKWLMRMVGWLMLFGGTSIFFQPIITAFDSAPFLGLYVCSFTSYVVYYPCLFVTVMAATLMIALAHSMYRPIIGLAYFMSAGCLVIAPLAICYALSK